MGKKKEHKMRKDKNKEGVTSLLENESLDYDCLEDMELNSNQGRTVDVKNEHKQRKKSKRKVVEVNDVDKVILMERRSKGNEEKVISQKDGGGEEHDVEQRVCKENLGGSKSANKKIKKYRKEKEAGEDVGRVNSEMNGVVENDRKVKKSKRKCEKISYDIMNDDFSDGKGRHSAVGKISKVEDKSHKGDLFTGSANESNGSHCKERKRVGGIESNDSESNKQFADTDMGKSGKKMKTKKILMDNELGSEGRDDYDTTESRLGMAACESIPYITLEGQTVQDIVNSEMHESGKIKKKQKKKTKIELAQVEANKHLLKGKEGNEELTNEKNVETIGQSSHLADEGKFKRGIGSSEVGGDGKNTKSKKSKMRKENKHVSEGEECNEVSRNGKGVESSEHSSKLKSKKKSKRVSFSDEVEVLDLIRGKRFTKEEDEKIIDSVHSYIRSHGLGNEGLKMVLNCRLYPELKNCWKEIVAVLPNRPHESVYYRAHTLLERAEDRKWAPEERELVRRFYEKHGADWRMLADALGKHRKHVKDCWRRIKFDTKTSGWSQEEYQTLFDLVNQDLRMRALEENRKSKHGMLRDNIPWESISDILTRSNSNCCRKWYEQLTSPMVVEGIWSDTDDYRLVGALYELDACCIEEVEWDFLLEHRTGDICRKRWNHMVRHIGDHGNKSFVEQVEILSKRYCPNLVEQREAFDSKPVVD